MEAMDASAPPAAVSPSWTRSDLSWVRNVAEGSVPTCVETASCVFIQRLPSGESGRHWPDGRAPFGSRRVRRIDLHGEGVCPAFSSGLNARCRVQGIFLLAPDTH